MGSAFAECARCGNCCRYHGFVRLSESDLGLLAQALGLTPESAAERFTELMPDRTALTLAEREDGSCVLLAADGSCRIHDAKPKQCRDFPHRWSFPDVESVCAASRPSSPGDSHED